MNKILVVGLFFFCSIAFAAPVGNPAFPKVLEEGFIFSPASKFSIRLGYEGNFVLDKKLKQKNNPVRDSNFFSLYLNSGVATLNLLNRLDLFGTYGKGKIEADWISEEDTNVLYYLDLKSNDQETWSYGTKIIFFEWGKINFSAGGRQLFIEPEISSFTKEGIVYSAEGSKIKYKEWQVDVGLSYKTTYLIPYFCAKYSKAKAEFLVDGAIGQSFGSNFLKMKNKNQVGIAIGCTFSNNKFFMLNGEVRLFDEEAFTISGDVKF